MKLVILLSCVTDTTSPSMRREWIEIDKGTSTAVHLLSPSMRREWIEMMMKH